MKMYLRPIGNCTIYSDSGDYINEPFQREGYEWVLGSPGPGLITAAKAKSNALATVNDLFGALPVEMQMVFAGLESLVRKFAQAGQFDKAIAVVTAAPIPEELAETCEPIRAAILTLLNDI